MIVPICKDLSLFFRCYHTLIFIFLKTQQSLEIYHEVIEAPKTLPEKLRVKARLHAAKIHYTQAKPGQPHHYRRTIRVAQSLLYEIIDVPSFDQVDANDWARTRLLDAEIDEYHIEPRLCDTDFSRVTLDRAYRIDAAKNYASILQIKGLNIDPALMFQAAYRCAKLSYNFPQEGLAIAVNPEDTMTYIVNEMIKAYNNMTSDQQQATVVDIQEFNKLKKWGNKARLQKAERLSQPEHERGNRYRSDCEQAFQLYHDIIRSPESDVDTKTLNEARVNLADMYRKGQGTLMNTDEAQRLYASVLAQPKNTVSPLAQDHVSTLAYERAKFWLDILTKRKNGL